MKSPPPPHSLKFKTSIHFQLPNLSLSSSLLFPPKSHHTHQNKQLGSLPPPTPTPYILFSNSHPSQIHPLTLMPQPSPSNHLPQEYLSSPQPSHPQKAIIHQSKQLRPLHALPHPFSPALAWHPATHSSLSPSFHQRSLKAPNLFLLTSPPISQPYLSFIRKHA